MARAATRHQLEERVKTLDRGPVAWVQRAGGDRIFWALLVVVAFAAALVYTSQFVVGVIVGSLYALAAVGLTLIYSITRTPHFAHGDALMLASYLAFFALTGTLLGSEQRDTAFPLHLDRLPGASEHIWRFSFGYGLILALLVAAALMIPILIAVDQVAYRPLYRRGASTAMIAVASLGVAIAMRGVMLLLWGSTPRRYSSGIRQSVDLWGLPRLVADQYFILAAAGVLVAAVSYLLYRTKVGKAMRAMADNPDLARASGIVTADVRRWTWMAGGALIAVAGVLLALQSQLKPELGFILLLPIFAAAILGGIGSPAGALVGGLIVGVASEVTVAVGVIGGGYKIAVAFAVLIVVILVRPRGLFGVRI